MKFNAEKLKQVSRSMTQSERQEIKDREENRDWLALSAKFALLLRHILRTEKITQVELASRMGVSNVQISKILSGKENIGLQTISKVERALGRSLVSFRDNAGSSVFTPGQCAYTQVFTLPVFNVRNESSMLIDQPLEIYSTLSNNNILV